MNARPARVRSAPTTLATLSAVSRSTHNATATNPAPAAAHTAATVHHTHRRIRARPLHQVPNGTAPVAGSVPPPHPPPGSEPPKRTRRQPHRPCRPGHRHPAGTDGVETGRDGKAGANTAMTEIPETATGDRPSPRASRLSGAASS